MTSHPDSELSKFDIDNRQKRFYELLHGSDDYCKPCASEDSIYSSEDPSMFSEYHQQFNNEQSKDDSEIIYDEVTDILSDK